MAMFTARLTPMMLFSTSTVIAASPTGPATVCVRVSSGAGAAENPAILARPQPTVAA